MTRLSLVVFVLALLGAPASAQPHWTVDHARSRLGFTVQWSGEAFSATFKSWKAEIAFDPADLARSKAIVTIDIGSETSDFPDNDDGLKGTQGFETAKYPAAKFETTRITHVQENNYVAEGALTLHGMTKPITLPFALTIDGKIAHMTARAVLMRADFALARGEFSSDMPIARAVTVTIDLTATRS
jgi:polyisoprenoid-binding protein YceI